MNDNKHITVKAFAEKFAELAEKNPNAIVFTNRLHKGYAKDICLDARDIDGYFCKKTKSDKDKLYFEPQNLDAVQANGYPIFHAVMIDFDLGQEQTYLGDVLNKDEKLAKLEPSYNSQKEMLEDIKDKPMEEQIKVLHSQAMWWPNVGTFAWYLIPDGPSALIHNTKTFDQILEGDVGNNWKNLFKKVPGVLSIFVCKFSFDELVEQRIVRIGKVDKMLRNLRKRRHSEMSNSVCASSGVSSGVSDNVSTEKGAKIIKL